MNCNEAQHIINQGTFNNLTPDFNTHIEKCEPCKREYEKMKEYIWLTQEIKNADILLNEPEKLTRSIIDRLEKPETEKVKAGRTLHSFIRIAASIALLAILGFYYQQRQYIEKSVIALEEKYSRSKANIAFTNNYNSCLQSAEPLLSEFMESSGNLSKNLPTEPLFQIKRKIKDGTIQICQQTFYEFIEADNKKKQEIVSEFFQSNSKN